MGRRHRCTHFYQQAKWNALPKNYQAIVTAAAGLANIVDAGDTTPRNPAALKRLVGGRRAAAAFPQPVMEACFKASNEIYAEISATNRGLQEGPRHDAGVPQRPVSVVAGRGIHLRQLHDPHAHAHADGSGKRCDASGTDRCVASLSRPASGLGRPDAPPEASDRAAIAARRATARQFRRGTRHEASSIPASGRPRRRGDRSRRARHRAIDAGDQVASDLELPEVARHHLRRVGSLRQGGRRGDRQQVPDPGLRRRRDRAGPAGGRRRAERHGRDVPHRVVLLFRQGSDLRLRHRGAVRPQQPHAEPPGCISAAASS